MILTELNVAIDQTTFEPIATAKIEFPPDDLYHLSVLGDAGLAVIGKAFIDAYHRAKYHQTETKAT